MLQAAKQSPAGLVLTQIVGSWPHSLLGWFGNWPQMLMLLDSGPVSVALLASSCAENHLDSLLKIKNAQALASNHSGHFQSRGRSRNVKYKQAPYPHLQGF